MMKLDVVSEQVLPSERLKRLLRFGNFLGNCGDGKKCRVSSWLRIQSHHNYIAHWVMARTTVRHPLEGLIMIDLI